jgi:hypothetical protein
VSPVPRLLTMIRPEGEPIGNRAREIGEETEMPAQRRPQRRLGRDRQEFRRAGGGVAQGGPTARRRRTAPTPLVRESPFVERRILSDHNPPGYQSSGRKHTKETKQSVT